MGINKKKEDDDNFFISLVALSKWIKIFLAPVFLFGLVGLAVFYNLKSQFYAIMGISIIVIGIVCGVLLAEYVRKRYGMIEFDARHEATPDIDKWLEEEREKYKNNIK